MGEEKLVVEKREIGHGKRQRADPTIKTIFSYAFQKSILFFSFGPASFCPVGKGRCDSVGSDVR